MVTKQYNHVIILSDASSDHKSEACAKKFLNLENEYGFFKKKKQKHHCIIGGGTSMDS